MPLGEVVSGRHLPALDGLRALAVGVVVVYHAGFSIPGDLGVSTFFVLSGFLITWLLRRELDETKTISLRAFYVRRTLRIFPAYYFFVLVSIVLDTVRHDPWTTDRIGAALLYLVNYHNAFTDHEGPIAHAWSLAVEEQFYLLWPLAFIFMARGGARRVRIGLIVTLLAVVAWRSFLFLQMHASTTYVYNAFDTRFDSLAVGCLMAMLVDLKWFQQFAARLAASVIFPVLVVVLIWYSRLGISRDYRYSLGFTVEAVLIGCLILQLLQMAYLPAFRWLQWRAVRYLGKISYPIYLWHILAFGVARHLVSGLGAQFLLGSLIVILAASGSYYLIERPALRLKERFVRA